MNADFGSVSPSPDQENTMKQLHASRTPLTMTCSASLDVQLPIHTSDESSDLGNACHDVLAEWVADGYRPNAIAEACTRWRVECDDLAPLVYTGWRSWKEKMSDWFPGVRTEVGMTSGILTGTADLLSTPEERVIVGDWKSGYCTDSDYRHQLRSYAWLAMQEHPWAREAVASIIWLRDNSVDSEHFTRAALDEWYDSLLQTVEGPHHYAPGRWCSYCPRYVECDVRLSDLRNAIDAFLSQPIDEVDVPAELLGPLLDRVKIVETACERARAMIRATVIAAGGRLATSEGREFVIEHQVRRSINFKPAAAILEQTLGTDTLAGLLTISKTDLETAVRAQAPRGMKQQAVVDLMAQLESARAVATKTIERMELKRGIHSTARLPAGTGTGD